MNVRITIIMQVSTNGVVSFGTNFNDHDSRPFPLSTSDILITPFWEDSNVGLVLFRLSDHQTLLNEVGSTINDTLEFDFTPTMLFIVTLRIFEIDGSQINVWQSQVENEHYSTVNGLI